MNRGLARTAVANADFFISSHTAETADYVYFALTHSSLWRRVIRPGERFFLLGVDQHSCYDTLQVSSRRGALAALASTSVYHEIEICVILAMAYTYAASHASD